MADGFDMKELDSYTKRMLSVANDKMPKESKKLVKKEAGKLNIVDKKVYKSMGIGLEPTDTPNNKKIINRFKAGKAYKFNGVWSARALNSAPHAHLINNGFIHKPHKNQSGKEVFVPGYHFIEKAAAQFEEQYYDDCEQFVEDMLDKGL